MQIDQLIFLGAILIMISVLAGQLSNRIGAPVLLTFLLVGIFAGEDGPGGIHFSDTELAHAVCSVALAVILFDGGLHTRMASFRIVRTPAFLLATVGVAVTALITGGFASWWLNVSWLDGMLIGSVVASTDAAAVFLLLHQRGVRIRPRVNALLQVESGLNDPMAVFLTLGCIQLLLTPEGAGWFSLLQLFVQQMGLGLLIGYGGGLGLCKLLRAFRLDAGVYAVFTVVGGLAVFGGANLLGGSGFLATYVAGLTFANGGFAKMSLIRQFNDSVAWIAQLVMLLMLGLLVTPSRLVEYIIPALGISLVLVFLARPLAVVIALPGLGFSWRERGFIGWVGLRGAVPIYLALLPALHGIAYGHYFFNVAFIIVLVSLVVQGWTIQPLARRLGLSEEPVDES